MPLRTATREVERPFTDEARAFQEIVAADDFDWNEQSDRQWLVANIIRSQNMSRHAWDNYRRLGEVHKAISRAARIAGYARLRCVKINPDGTDGDTVMTGEPADIVRGIYSPYGGVRGLIDRFFTLMKVPGDSYPIIYRDEDGDQDGYHFLSSHEIQRASIENVGTGDPMRNIQWITLPSATMGSGSALIREVKAVDILGRVWLPGRQYLDEPDSPLGALETECEVLWGLTESMKANISNRFILGGLMGFPIEIQNVKVPGMPQGGMDILEYIEKAMVRSAQAGISDPVARLPILMRANGEALQQIIDRQFDREIFETDLLLRKELIERILFGLDIQVQATRGSEDSNHFSAWAQSDEEIRIAVQPDLDTVCWALTRLVLHKRLSEEFEWAPERIQGLRVAWDMSESVSRTNKQEDTRQGFDRLLASGNSVLRAGGLSVTDDRMSERERIQVFGVKEGNPYLAFFDGEGYDDIDWEKVKEFSKTAKPGPNPEKESEEEPSAGPGVGDPGAPSETERKRTRRTTRTPSG